LPYRVSGLLTEAALAAEQSKEPRHRVLLGRIHELQYEVGRPPELADLFAGVG
jgi:hypothetical protein